MAEEAGVIHIGLDDEEKREAVEHYMADRGLSRVVVLSPERFAPSFASRRMEDPASQCDGRRGLYVAWPDIIEYRYYYRLIQDVDNETLVVVNECLRTKQRHDLTYNCIRNILNRTRHVLVLQYLPCIESPADFMTLFDFATQSRWRREPFDTALVRREAAIRLRRRVPVLEQLPVETPPAVRIAYARKRAELFAAVRADPDKDPHVIPRNLALVSGRAKVKHVDPDARYAARNARLGLPNLTTWRDLDGLGERIAIELPHGFIELADALTVTRQQRLQVMVADTKADRWYFDRAAAWVKEVAYVSTALHG